MPIEANVGSNLGQGGVKRGAKPPIKNNSQGETRYLVPAETPRERMLRVMSAVKKKRK